MASWKFNPLNNPEEVTESKPPDKKLKEEIEAVRNKNVVRSDNDSIELSEDVFREVFGDNYFTDLKQKAKEAAVAAENLEFRTEEFEFKKFTVIPGFKAPYMSKDLQLSNLREWEVPIFSKILNFAAEMKRIGALATADFFARQIFFYLNLKVSVDGFGRKELNTSRQEVKSSSKEEIGGKKGFQLVRGD